MIHFTSNLLLSNPSMVESRGFSSIDEMNETLIQNWNERVKPNDIVYHLGNFAWDPLIADEALEKLNGNINFMTGEWDKALYEVIDRFEGIHQILNNQILFIDSHHLIVSYWPMIEWPGKDIKTTHIHGGSVKTKIDEEQCRINCNVDNWQLAPIDLDTIKDLSKIFGKKIEN